MEEPKMQKLKIGDKVKILWEKISYRSDDCADIGEIFYIYPEFGRYVVRGFLTNDPLYALTFKEDELVLLEEAPRVAKFKVDDNKSELTSECAEEREKENTMKKSSLNQGALVELRNGDIYILIGKVFVQLESGRFMPLARYEEDLRIARDIAREAARNYDVMKVYNPLVENSGYWRYITNQNINWHWERKEELQAPKFKVNEWVKTPAGYGKIISVKADISRYKVDISHYEVDLGRFVPSCFEEHELSKLNSD